MHSKDYMRLERTVIYLSMHSIRILTAKTLWTLKDKNFILFALPS